MVQAQLKLNSSKISNAVIANLCNGNRSPESDSEAILNLRQQIHDAKDELDKFTRQRTVLKDDPIIESIKPRFFMPSGINCFDTPLFEFWTRQSAEEKLQSIKKWLHELDCLRIPVLTVLYLWRLCADCQRSHCNFRLYARKRR